MSAYDIWKAADSAERVHASALPDGADLLAYAQEGARLHIAELKALEDVFGLKRGTCVKVYYQDWSDK